MQPDIMSLSLGSWLELPVLRFEEWQKGRGEVCHRSDKRVQLGDVADYYLDYVDKVGLQDNFLNGVEVTNVINLEKKLHRPCSGDSRSSSVSLGCTPEQEMPVSDMLCDDTQLAASEEPLISDITHLSCFGALSSRETSPCTSCSSDSEDDGVFCSCTKILNRCAKYRWCVRGKQVDQHGVEQNIIVCARNVVLACGVGGCPRKLNVPGENLPFVVQNFSGCLSSLASDRLPLLVVGAGLSAADTILLAMSKGIKVIHVFYQDINHPKLIYHNMPREIYGEYTHLFSLMQEKVHSDYYTPFSRHRVSEFKPGGVCVIQDEKGQCTSLKVSQAQVLIGSEAHLEFLPENIVRKLGVHPDLPIHAKKNPIEVDPFTFECENVPFLYALGPLVGDNFVRFVLGGPFGVTQSLHQKNE